MPTNKTKLGWLFGCGMMEVERAHAQNIAKAVYGSAGAPAFMILSVAASCKHRTFLLFLFHALYYCSSLH